MSKQIKNFANKITPSDTDLFLLQDAEDNSYKNCTKQQLFLGLNTKATDPYFSNTKSLLHFEGSNGSTNFLDTKAKKFTGFGSAQLTTAISKFGDSCLSLNGSNSFLQASYDADFNLSTGDFTIECWIQPNNISTTQIIAGIWDTATNNRCYTLLIDTSKFGFYWSTDGTLQAANTILSSINAPTNYWSHIAGIRRKNTMYLAINGVIAGSVNFSGSIRNSNTNFRIGAGIANNLFLNAFVDEFRLTQGVGRYNSFYSINDIFSDS